MALYTVVSEQKEDGTYDLLQYNTKDETYLEVVGNITDPEFPNGKPSDEEVAARVREQRNNILKDVVDPLVSNPLRWSDLTEAEQTEWAQYRTDLLNVPQQSGFPIKIVWPETPTTGTGTPWNE
tara:strand:- start:1332 stop:1703 length:372 start_codon:yes stop_codon:yes gene_type:complete